MRQDIKLKGKLKGYTQTPLMLTLLFAAMDVWMYVLNVKAGILGTIFVAIYFFVMLFVYWRNQPILLNEPSFCFFLHSLFKHCRRLLILNILFYMLRLLNL